MFVAALLSYFVSTFFRDAARLATSTGSAWGVGLVVIAALLMFLGVKESALVTAGFLMIEFAILDGTRHRRRHSPRCRAFPCQLLARSVFSGSPGFASALAFLCFVGFEVQRYSPDTSQSGEDDRPRHDDRRRHLVHHLRLGAGWSWQALVRRGHRGRARPDSGQLVPMVASANLGAWMGVVFEVVLLTSLFATLIVVFNTTAQYTLNMSRALSPRGRLAQVHRKHGSPANSGIALAS